jgi:hypothetical protein
MPETPRTLRQTAGCLIEPNRWYLFDRMSGAQIADQPRRGFRAPGDARDFLQYRETEDPSRFIVAQGRDASTV